MSNEHEIIVIGSGISGLSAAETAAGPSHDGHLAIEADFLRHRALLWVWIVSYRAGCWQAGRRESDQASLTRLSRVLDYLPGAA